MTRKPLTDAEKGRILGLREEKVPIKEICKRTRRAKSTIMSLLAKARTLPPNEIPAHKPRLGVKRKTSKTTDRLLKNAVMKNPRITARQLKEMYPDLLKNVTERTIQHRLQKDLDLPCRTAARKPLLTDKMKKKRLEFAKAHRDWTFEDWKEVMWSDESTFQVLSSHRVKVRRPSNSSRYDSRFTVKTVKHSPSVMVWACFSAKLGRGGLFFLPKNTTMNADRYIGVLNDHLYDSFSIHDTSIFMHDGAPCHTSRKVKQDLQKKNIRVLEWPGNSPDLNPIENAWKMMKDKVKEEKPTSVPHLQDIIKNVWTTQIDIQYFINLVQSMPKRMLDVIHSRGDMTKY